MLILSHIIASKDRATAADQQVKYQLGIEIMLNEDVSSKSMHLKMYFRTTLEIKYI